MGVARFLTTSRLRYPIVAAISCSCLLHATKIRNFTYFDTRSLPSQPRWVNSSARNGPNKPVPEDANTPQQHSTVANTKKGDAETIDKANDLDRYGPSFDDDDENAWAAFSRNFENVKEGVSRIQWTGLGDKITDFILPGWARSLPGSVQKLQSELSMEPGSLADDIWQEAHDSDINPEILWNAKVRVGETLSDDEVSFRRKRKEHILPAFAKYLGLDENDIHADDIPTIAMCGSGGGLRAMVAGTSSYLCTQQAGLFDCVTYTAGVSGSCWLQTLYFSSLGKQNHETLLDHLKSRIGTHIAFPPTALKLVTSAPTNKYILSGFVEKLKGDPGATFGLVDIYSLLLAARLMVPHGDLDVHDRDLKLSNQRQYLERGQHPMPIYTVVRHEIPVMEESKQEKPITPKQREVIKEKARQEAWFEWIELTPWEVWCEEFGAGIPSWALGRPFEDGVNKVLKTGVALPEIRQSLLLGIYGSAFCATLSHYYKEIKPLLAGMAGFDGLDGLLEGKQEDLVRIHPVEPATIPNFVFGMKGKLPGTCPESVFKTDHLQVMDAGMSNNLPIYPLLRPGRDVEVLIAFDASADVQRENWLSVVDGYAQQRGIKSWPLGTGWPKKSVKPEENARVYEEAEARSAQAAAGKVAESREARRQKHAGEEEQAASPTSSSTSSSSLSPTEQHEIGELGYCNVWVGTMAERKSSEEPPPSKRISWDNPEDSTFQLMRPDSSIALVYFPLLPNPQVEGVHPDKTDYLSTWNFIYTPEQVDKVVELARRNFESGEEDVKQTIRAVYERKRRRRLGQEPHQGQ